MRLDQRFYMSLSSNPDHEQPENGINSSRTEAMVLSDEHQLPAKVANVSREELRRYAQCKRVGSYLLGRTVGEGSFAKVKEAIHILTGEKVAIKIIDKNRARKDRYVSKNMRREARLLQMIRHPHIVQLLEIVETSQCYYLVFEFADGGDLMDYICKRKKLEEDEVRKFIRQIISAVEYLHRLGIMHRDLKVENLLLDANKNIKIIDFGLSNTIFSPDPNNENHCTTQCGSPAYAAPELLVRKDYGPQIDVWSIGVNLYAMLTGRLPYTVEPFNISTLYNKMLKRQMNVIPEYLSEACKNMIHQLLNPDPKERLHILEAVRHNWITRDQRDPLVLIPCPNHLCEEVLDDRILDHVEEQLKLNSDDVIRDVIQNRATKNSCVYHLLVRRLERYEREQRKLISTPPPKIHNSEEKLPQSREHKAIPTNQQGTTQKNGLVFDKRSSPKTHIMENPFKTIKVALIRQKKAVKKEEKSKRASNGKTSTQDPVSCSASSCEPACKPKLCTVKRVALVKFSPARRSLRGLTGSSRNCTNSPRPGRRRNYFEGLQHKRKSPKTRRRHAGPDDSFSSAGSTPRHRSIDDTENAAKQTQHVEDQMNNNITVASCGNSKIAMNDVNDIKSQKSPTNDSHAKANIPDCTVQDQVTGAHTSETITHLYTDKGVVLKRDSSGENGNHKTNYTQEYDTVQHRIFHGGDTGDTEDVKDEQPTSHRNTHHTTPGKQTAKEKVTALKQTKPVTPKRAPSKLNNLSRIPVLAEKNSSPSRPSPLSPSRLAPRTPSTATANTKLPTTATRKNDVATLADKYNKCVSVIVVKDSRSARKSSPPASKILSINRKGSLAADKGSTLNGNRSLPTGNNAKGMTAKPQGVSNTNNCKNGRTALNDKISRVDAAKTTPVSQMGRAITSKKGNECINPTLFGNGSKKKAEKFERVEDKGDEMKEIRKSGQNVEEIRNGSQRQKAQVQAQPRRPSYVKSAKERLACTQVDRDCAQAKESLATNASRTTKHNKDSKQTTENERKNSTINQDNKFSTAAQRSLVKSPEAKDTKTWTGDERRKISNYRKANETQQTKLAWRQVDEKVP